MAKISVLGAGSWGTALAVLLYNNGHEVMLWSALADEVKMLCDKREHETKLPGVRLPDNMEITTDLEKVFWIRMWLFLLCLLRLPEVRRIRCLPLPEMVRSLLMWQRVWKRIR